MLSRSRYRLSGDPARVLVATPAKRAEPQGARPRKLGTGVAESALEPIQFNPDHIRMRQSSLRIRSA